MPSKYKAGIFANLPPPCVEIKFSAQNLSEDFIREFKFPTPYGDLKFSITQMSNLNEPKTTVFPTPYGDLKFSTCESQTKNRRVFLFPTPYGDLKFSTESEEANALGLKMFPTPYGDLKFSTIISVRR